MSLKGCICANIIILFFFSDAALISTWQYTDQRPTDLETVGISKAQYSKNNQLTRLVMPKCWFSIYFVLIPLALNHYLLGNFVCFFCYLLNFFKANFFLKILSGVPSVSNSFDLDQAQRSVGPDLVQIVGKSYQQTVSVGEELICNLLKVTTVLFFHRYLVIASSSSNQFFFISLLSGEIFFSFFFKGDISYMVAF